MPAQDTAKAKQKTYTVTTSAGTFTRNSITPVRAAVIGPSGTVYGWHRTEELAYEAQRSRNNSCAGGVVVTVAEVGDDATLARLKAHPPSEVMRGLDREDRRTGFVIAALIGGRS